MILLITRMFKDHLHLILLFFTIQGSLIGNKVVAAKFSDKDFYNEHKDDTDVLSDSDFPYENSIGVMYDEHINENNDEFHSSSIKRKNDKKLTLNVRNAKEFTKAVTQRKRYLSDGQNKGNQLSNVNYYDSKIENNDKFEKYYLKHPENSRDVITENIDLDEEGLNYMGVDPVHKKKVVHLNEAANVSSNIATEAILERCQRHLKKTSKANANDGDYEYTCEGNGNDLTAPENKASIEENEDVSAFKEEEEQMKTFSTPAKHNSKKCEQNAIEPRSKCKLKEDFGDLTPLHNEAYTGRHKSSHVASKKISRISKTSATANRKHSEKLCMPLQKKIENKEFLKGHLKTKNSYTDEEKTEMPTYSHKSRLKPSSLIRDEKERKLCSGEHHRRRSKKKTEHSCRKLKRNDAKNSDNTNSKEDKGLPGLESPKSQCKKTHHSSVSSSLVSEKNPENILPIKGEKGLVETDMLHELIPSTVLPNSDLPQVNIYDKPFSNKDEQVIKNEGIVNNFDKPEEENSNNKHIYQRSLVNPLLDGAFKYIDIIDTDFQDVANNALCENNEIKPNNLSFLHSNRKRDDNEDINTRDSSIKRNVRTPLPSVNQSQYISPLKNSSDSENINKLDEDLENEIYHFWKANDEVVPETDDHIKRSIISDNSGEDSIVSDMAIKKNNADDDKIEQLKFINSILNISSESSESVTEDSNSGINGYSVELSSYDQLHEDNYSTTLNSVSNNHKSKGKEINSKGGRNKSVASLAAEEIRKSKKTIAAVLPHEKNDEIESAVTVDALTTLSKKHSTNKKVSPKNRVSMKPFEKPPHPAAGPPKFKWCNEENNIVKDQEYEDTLRGKVVLRIVEIILAKVYKSPKMMYDFGFCKSQKKSSGNDEEKSCGAENSILKSQDLKEIMESMAKLSYKGCNQLPPKLKEFLEWLVKLKTVRSVKMKEQQSGSHLNCTFGDSAFLFHRYDSSYYDDPIEKKVHNNYYKPQYDNTYDYDHLNKEQDLLFENDLQNDFDLLGDENSADRSDTLTDTLVGSNNEKLKRFVDNDWSYLDNSNVFNSDPYLQSSFEDAMYPRTYKNSEDYYSNKIRRDLPIEKLEELADDMGLSRRNHLEDKKVLYRGAMDKEKYMEQRPYDIRHSQESEHSIDSMAHNYDDLSQIRQKRDNKLNLQDLLLDKELYLKPGVPTDHNNKNDEVDDIINDFVDDKNEMLDVMDQKEIGFYTPIVFHMPDGYKRR